MNMKEKSGGKIIKYKEEKELYLARYTSSMKE